MGFSNYSYMPVAVQMRDHSFGHDNSFPEHSHRVGVKINIMYWGSELIDKLHHD